MVKKIAILPGGFKPPHKGHLSALQYMLKENGIDHCIVYIGKSLRDEITPEQSYDIWNIYKKYLNLSTDISISPVTPVKSLYDYCDNNKDQLIYVGACGEDIDRYSYFDKNKDIYNYVKVIKIPPQYNRMSGSDVRKILKEKTDDTFSFLPSMLTAEDVKCIKTILRV
jgi:phosphopantetheine adenylyltransferase